MVPLSVKIFDENLYSDCCFLSLYILSDRASKELQMIYQSQMSVSVVATVAASAVVAIVVAAKDIVVA